MNWSKFLSLLAGWIVGFTLYFTLPVNVYWLLLLCPSAAFFATYCTIDIISAFSKPKPKTENVA